MFRVDRLVRNVRQVVCIFAWLHIRRAASKDFVEVGKSM